MIMKKNMKALIAGSLLVVGTMTFAGCQQAQQQSKDLVVTMDYGLVMEKHPKMEKAQADMRAEYDKVVKEVGNMEGVPDDQRQAKVMEVQQKLEKMQRDTIEPIKTEVDATIDGIMKEKGAYSVIDKRAVIRGGTDITKDVLVKIGVSAEEADKLISERQ